MNKATAQHNDNIINIALREYGATEGLLQLYKDNGLASVDEAINPGDELLIDTEFSVEVSRQLISDREVKETTRRPVVQMNQNIVDMAIQEYGAMEGIMPMIRGNNMEAGQELAPGRELLVKASDIVTPLMTGYFRRNKISVATGHDFNEVIEVDLWIDELENFVVDEKENKIIV